MPPLFVWAANYSLSAVTFAGHLHASFGHFAHVAAFSAASLAVQQALEHVFLQFLSAVFLEQADLAPHPPLIEQVLLALTSVTAVSTLAATALHPQVSQA